MQLSGNIKRDLDFFLESWICTVFIQILCILNEEFYESHQSWISWEFRFSRQLSHVLLFGRGAKSLKPQLGKRLHTVLLWCRDSCTAHILVWWCPQLTFTRFLFFFFFHGKCMSDMHWKQSEALTCWLLQIDIDAFQLQKYEIWKTFCFNGLHILRLKLASRTQWGRNAVDSPFWILKRFLCGKASAMRCKMSFKFRSATSPRGAFAFLPRRR